MEIVRRFRTGDVVRITSAERFSVDPYKCVGLEAIVMGDPYDFFNDEDESDEDTPTYDENGLDENGNMYYEPKYKLLFFDGRGAISWFEHRCLTFVRRSSLEEIAAIKKFERLQYKSMELFDWVRHHWHKIHAKNPEKLNQLIDLLEKAKLRLEKGGSNANGNGS